MIVCAVQKHHMDGRRALCAERAEKCKTQNQYQFLHMFRSFPSLNLALARAVCYFAAPASGSAKLMKFPPEAMRMC